MHFSLRVSASPRETFFVPDTHHLPDLYPNAKSMRFAAEGWL